MSMQERLVVLILGVLVIVFAGTTFSFYRKYSNLQANPQQAAQATVQELIDKVSKLIVLPEGETPTVATVVDPAKLKDQVFFAKAKAGDKVLIYTKAKKAILFSPDSNMIIEVAPVNIGEPQAAIEQPASTVPAEPVQ